MSKLNLADVSNLMGSPTAAANTINSNSSLITAAIENTLSRNGQSPNQMNSDLDMNHNNLLNIKDLDVDSLSIDGQPVTVTDNFVVTNASQVTYNRNVTGSVNQALDARIKAMGVYAADFGIKGDGSTDNTAAMIAAHALGLPVIYPTGNYVFTKVGDVATGGIVGEGRDVTLLPTNSDSSNIFNFTGTSKAPTFRNFSILGQLNGSVPNKPAGAAIALNPASGEISSALFDGVTVAYFPIGLDWVRASYARVTNCQFYVYSVAGIRVDNLNHGDSGDSVIMSSLFNSPNTLGAGILHRASGGLKILGNKFLAGGTGYTLGLTSAVPTSIVLIVGNSIENMTNQCIALARTSGTSSFSHVVIQGNELAVGPIGIQDDGSDFIDGVIIANNTIKLTSGTGYGMNINSLNQFIIQGNVIQGGGGAPAGITIAAACTNGKVGYNTFNNLASTVVNASSTTVVEKEKQSGSTTTSTSGWNSFGSLFSGPTTSVTFPIPYTVPPTANEVILVPTSTNGAVSAIITSISTTGFTYVPVSAVTGIAAQYSWNAFGVI
jgi:hypothetical protein